MNDKREAASNDPHKGIQTFQARETAGTPQFIKQGAFLIVGAVASYGFFQWQTQQQELERLAQMVEQMQQEPAADVTSRNASLDLVAIGATTPTAPAVDATAAITPAAPVEQAITVAVTEAEADAVPTSNAAESAADRIRVLASAAAVTRDETQLEKDARRLETLAIVHAGVQELVAAVVAGDYDIHTNYEDEYFSGRIHFEFVGHEKDQVELEQFISEAAEEGIIAYSSSVVDGDGKVNGHILLFDLVERALENGTLTEQQAGKKMREEALEMLAADAPLVAATQNAAGQRTYVVQPGDSLAYIALQFYGNTQDFARIFVANRDVLRSPERINVGQRLIIPEV